MTQQGGMPGFGSQRSTSADGNGYTSGPERGSRRKKLAGYLKAANELRQSYMGSSQFDGEDGYGVPGSFPDLAAARSGEEEMILFPSYARRHYPRKRSHHDLPGSSHDLQSKEGTGDAEYWKREWEKYEDGNSVVDVDVRGWIYSPHRGAMTRKQRFVVGIARRLSGVPAPSASADSRASSPLGMVHGKLESHAARHEEEQIEREAASLARKGEGAADMAWRGEYCEPPSRDSDRYSVRSTPGQSRTPSPERERSPRLPFRASEGSIYDDASSLNSLEKRASWNQPQDMSPAEISVANAHLMARLRPFLHIPLINTSLTVFFYNEKTSKSRSITTNESGHFSIRTPLDFIPTNVRVLASDKLSATEEVQITEPKGVSVISDIDDTIKHSGIGNGAKEIFRNVFIRELGDLTIEGVKEWYSRMADTGVQFHYVSNAPWQLYPVLTSFFAMAGLPKGSYHLKQYNGMLQGIFEPVAERKKGTLEKIMLDFPERRFILVGDSGEADLELYTEIVLANPGRVLGVFIRDVTTITKPQGFFDSSLKPLRSRGSQSPVRGRSKDSTRTSFANRKSMPDLSQKPDLPLRPPARSMHTNSQVGSTGPTMGRLIDYDDSLTQSLTRSSTNPDPEKKPPPPRPTKPTSLRSVSGESLSMTPINPPPSTVHRKPIPPPKPRQYSTSEPSSNKQQPSPLFQTQTASPPGSRATSMERQSYRAAMRNKVISAYNSLPSWSSYAESQQPGPTSAPRPTPADDLNRKEKLPPPIPPRRNISSYPAAAAHYASNRLSGGWSGNPEGVNGANGGGGNGSGEDDQQLSKKEEMWRRRWATAKRTFEEQGVLLRSWRKGEDVMDDAVMLVERAKREESERGNDRKENDRRNGVEK